MAFTTPRDVLPGVNCASNSWNTRTARGSNPCSLTDGRHTDYHKTFSANWISRESFAVLSIVPAPLCGVPVASNNALLSSGLWKLARLITLKNSARNWVVSLSEIRVFLYTEQPKLTSPGPDNTMGLAFPGSLVRMGQTFTWLQCR